MIENPDTKATGNTRLSIKDISKTALELTYSVVNRKVEGITSLSAENEGWKVNVEVLERRAVPDTQDILSTYELKMTGQGELTGYKRTTMRKRGDRVSIVEE